MRFRKPPRSWTAPAGLLAAIVDSSDDAIVSKTLQGVITSWSGGAERMFGWTAGEAVGQPITLIVPDDRRAEEDEILVRIRRGQPVSHYETVRVTRDGRRLNISLSVSPVRNRAGVVIGASTIARDMTERRRLEDERERLLARERAARAEAEALGTLAVAISSSLDLGHVLQRVAEAARDLCRADLSRIALRERDGAVGYRYVSGTRLPGHERLRLSPGLGFEGRVLATGRPFRTADAPADPHVHPEYGARVLEAEGVKATMVVPILAAGGSIEGLVYVARRTPAAFTDDDERICGCLADQALVAIRNVRLYEDAERRRREAESLAAVARTINTLDLDRALANIAASACLLLQAQVAALYRLDAESRSMVLAAAGGPLAPLLTRDVSLPRGTGLVWLAAERREAAVSTDLLADERLVFTPDMRARIEAAPHRGGLAVPLIVQDQVMGVLFVGALPGRVFSVDDVRQATAFADQAAGAMRNAQLYRDAQRANRAKDEFLAMLGHELRNPLGAIAGALGVLRGLGADSAPAERARAVMDRQVQHLSRLVDDLLDVSRVTTGKVRLNRRPLELGALVAGAMATWRAAGRFRQHDVSVHTAPAWIDADETRLEQVVDNLVGNALKYTPAGGSVTVRVGPDGDDAMLEVGDTGEGIPPHLAGKVFELFVQGDRALDRAQGGLGIGLTLVKALVNLHGGAVETRGGADGKGTVFTVRLPRISAPPSPGPAAPAPTRVDGGRRVLVVEDNEDAREMLRIALELAGHSVFEASDGHAALAVAADAGPDVAVIDVGLPGLDGYEVARRLRADPGSRGMLLVAVTGYGQAEDRARALTAGFDAHLTKPVSPDQLTALIADRLAPSP